MRKGWQHRTPAHMTVTQCTASDSTAPRNHSLNDPSLKAEAVEEPAGDPATAGSPECVSSCQPQ